ncbi:AbrB/MazE/SpoVT family DNA-binding domain-containing protein [Burkholderia cepacia]|uniref:AbrB/MazE/SpoVT family DNA-binding domain-containing protein n=1 Tax=Burkholderia cepacia TaxID=292 RepID=UPI003EE1624A
MWKSHTALIARWGDSLAIHLPAELAKALELRVGDEIEFIVDEPCGLEARREFDVDALYYNNYGTSVASCLPIFVLAGMKHDFESMLRFKGQAWCLPGRRSAYG